MALSEQAILVAFKGTFTVNVNQVILVFRLPRRRSPRGYFYVVGSIRIDNK
jgi:hypothetical protein